MAGLPATNWNNLLGRDTFLALFVGAPNAIGNPSFLSPALWDIVAAEVLNQCDELDGVKDGIITEPDTCQFRPEAIQCSAGQTAGCVSKAQMDALTRIYQLLLREDGELVYSCYDPGAEGDGNTAVLLNGSIISIATVSVVFFFLIVASS